MRAVVCGGTGLVGGALVAQLSRHAVPTVVLGRRAGPVLPGVEWRVVDLADMAAADVPTGTTCAFSCLGTTRKTAGSRSAFAAVDHGLVARFAAACRTAGVAQFHVVSALGADANSRIFYNRVKGQMEDAVTQLGFPVLCIYRPSLLAGERAERRGGERFALAAARFVRPLMPRGLQAVDAAVVARAMRREAQKGSPGSQVLPSDAIARRGA